MGGGKNLEMLRWGYDGCGSFCVAAAHHPTVNLKQQCPEHKELDCRR